MSNAEEMIGLRDGLNEIGYGRWNSKQMKSAAKIFNDDLNRWAKTELGKASIEDDYEDLWGSFPDTFQPGAADVQQWSYACLD